MSIVTHSQAIAVRYEIVLRLDCVESRYTYKGGLDYSLKIIDNVRKQLKETGFIIVRDEYDRPVKIVANEYEQISVLELIRLPDDNQEKLMKVSVKTLGKGERNFYTVSHLTKEMFIKSLIIKVNEDDEVRFRHSVTNKMVSLTSDDLLLEGEPAFVVEVVTAPHEVKNMVVHGYKRGK